MFKVQLLMFHLITSLSCHFSHPQKSFVKTVTMSFTTREWLTKNSTRRNHLQFPLKKLRGKFNLCL